MVKRFWIEDTVYFFDGDSLNLYKEKMPQKDTICETRTINKKSLYTVTFFVTDQCNGKCRYCYEEHGKENMERLGADNAINTLKSRYEKIERVRFFGGEPLLNFEIIKYIVSELSKSIKIGNWEITTNAILLNDKILEFLVKYQFKVIVSMDGPEHIHDYLRLGCDHKRVLKAIKDIQKTSIKEKLEINCTYTKKHIEKVTLKELKEYFENIGVNYTISNVITNIEELKIEQNNTNLKKIIDQSYERLLIKSKNIGISPFVTAVINAVVRKEFHNEFCMEISDGLAFNISGKEFPCTKLLNVCDRENIELLQANSKNNKVCNNCWAKGLCFYCAANIYLKENIPYEAEKCELKLGYSYALSKLIYYFHKEPDSLQKIIDNYYS